MKWMLQPGVALMRQMSMTQQNAALVQEAAASALSFEDEARQLSAAVSAFKIREATATEAPAAAVAMPAAAPAHRARRPALAKPSRGR